MVMRLLMGGGISMGRGEACLFCGIGNGWRISMGNVKRSEHAQEGGIQVAVWQGVEGGV